jgi:hypothetical protein
MASFADAVQHLIPRGLFEVTGAADGVLDDLIGRKAAFYPSYDAVRSTWQFDYRDRDTVSNFLACECARFGCAAFQTYTQVEACLSQKDALPWALVEAYYAAFYAAHGLLRSFGVSCSHIDPGRATVLQRVLSVYLSTGVQFAGGQYAFTSDLTTGASFTVESLAGTSNRGGMHDVFWRLFDLQIGRLSPLILANANTPDAQVAWDNMNKLRAVLSYNSAGGWLSAIRNAIQYRHEMGVWYLNYSRSQRDSEMLCRLASAWKREPLQVQLNPGLPGGELTSFISACTFLGAIFRSVLVRINEVGSNKQVKSFVQYGPLRFLRDRQVES